MSLIIAALEAAAEDGENADYQEHPGVDRRQ